MIEPVTLDCGHIYCHECISKWLCEYNQRCPICRVKPTHMMGSDGVPVPAPAPPPTIDRLVTRDINTTRSQTNIPETHTHTRAQTYNRQDDDKFGTSKTIASSADCSAVEFAQTIAEHDIEPVICTLARRPAGRQAILDSPAVVRAITSNRREVKQTYRLQRGKEMDELVRKTSQAKGRVTKVSKKLCRVEARNKGLRTMLAKVKHTQFDKGYSIILTHTYLFTLRLGMRQRQMLMLPKSVAGLSRFLTDRSDESNT